jgi:hypothetical protein
VPGSHLLLFACNYTQAKWENCETAKLSARQIPEKEENVWFTYKLVSPFFNPLIEEDACAVLERLL